MTHKRCLVVSNSTQHYVFFFNRLMKPFFFQVAWLCHLFKFLLSVQNVKITIFIFQLDGSLKYVFLRTRKCKFFVKNIKNQVLTPFLLMIENVSRLHTIKSNFRKKDQNKKEKKLSHYQCLLLLTTVFGCSVH